MIVFVTATGTDAGKTAFTRGLARAAARAGLDVVAIKPFETGVTSRAHDAEALARAAGRTVEGPWYRAEAPVAPWAATLMGEAPPDWEAIVRCVRQAASEHSLCLVEGAGGVRVPVDSRREVVDLAVELGAAVLVVAPNQLGVLSYSLTAFEHLRSRGLEASLVLRDISFPDVSGATNATILAEKLKLSPARLRFVLDASDDALADAVVADPVLAQMLQSWFS